MRRRIKEREGKKQIAQTVKQRLAQLIVFLIAILLVMIFRMGNVFWPAATHEFFPGQEKTQKAPG